MNTNEMPWTLTPIPDPNHDIPVEPLLNDPYTDMCVQKMKYVAGFTNPWHTHNCAHGMSVLDGIF